MKKKELIKFLLTNSYKENRVKKILEKSEKIKNDNIDEMEDENFIENNYEVQGQNEDIYNNVDREEDKDENNDIIQFQSQINEQEFYNDNNINKDFKYDEDENENFKGEINYEKNEDNKITSEDKEPKDSTKIINIDNNIENDEQKKDLNKKEEIEDIEEEETYIPNDKLINLVYSKYDDFKTMYKLNIFCRTIRIFILYFKENENITEESIVNFCYNLLTKDFEKGKKIEIDPEIKRRTL